MRDAGSRNGTFVDSKRVEEQLLQDGAMLQVGGTFFAFHSTYDRSEPALLESTDLPVGPTGLRTFSPALQSVLRRLEAVAPSRVPVLLHGESGTGKELFARALHLLSGRTGEFVAVNCGAIAPNLVEAELFGYRRGAFSRARTGTIRACSGRRAEERCSSMKSAISPAPGTGCAPPRAAEESEVLPVGAVHPQRLDLRVVAATNPRHPEARVQEKHFRHDLLARLDAITLEIPPLRDRLEDVPLLLATLIARHSPGTRDLPLGACHRGSPELPLAVERS